MKYVTAGIIERVSYHVHNGILKYYKAGMKGVTKITREIDQEIGRAYIRVWCGDQLCAEFDQASVVGIYYKMEDTK